MKYLPMCKLCKDAIARWICLDCLSYDIRNWLPRHLRPRFDSFFSNVCRHFYGNIFNGFVVCIHCHRPKEAAVCSICFVHEVSQWLEGENQELSEEIMKFVPKGFKILESEVQYMDGAVPLTESRPPKEHFGICDECGEYSEELRLSSGEWVCRDCEADSE